MRDPVGRLRSDLRVRIDRIDLMLACALVVVVASYTLGYHLDWSQLDAPAEAAASVSAPEAGPAVPGAVAPGGAGETPQDDARQQAWDDMTHELARLVNKHQGRVAIYLTDLRSGRSWSYHEDDLFPAASLIKVPVMACVFARIADGAMSLSDVLVMHRHNRVGGSGSLKWRPDGTRLTVRELLQHMISESDNTATAMLLERMSFPYAQDEFPKLGLVYTTISPEGMSLRGGHVARENYTTAREMTMLLEKIYRGEMVDKHASEQMLDILKYKKAVASRLAKGLPPGWEIAHKTGLLRHACHDSAIFLTPNGDYAMTVLTGQNSNYKAAKDFITRLGKVTFVHFGGYPRYFARAYGKRHGQVALR